MVEIRITESNGVYPFWKDIRIKGNTRETNSKLFNIRN